MLPDGTPFTEEQMQELTRLHDELREQFMKNKDYATGLIDRKIAGEELDEQERKDLRLFTQAGETLKALEEVIIGEMSANIIGICEDAKRRARDGDPHWVAKWERMQPVYRTYMTLFTERALPKN